MFVPAICSVCENTHFPVCFVVFLGLQKHTLSEFVCINARWAALQQKNRIDDLLLETQILNGLSQDGGPRCLLLCCCQA